MSDRQEDMDAAKEDATGKDGAEAKPAIVLVRPQMGENIGAAARAMMNFALDEMRLVAPRDGWPNPKAYSLASRADRILDEARLVAHTGEAIADCHRVYAMTARRRDMFKPAMTPREAVADIRAALAGGQRAAVLFGAEKSGLDNDDVVLADTIIHIPANPAFSSLNLGQAVLLFAYEWFHAGFTPEPPRPLSGHMAPASKEELMHLFNHLETELEDADFFAAVPDKRPVMIRNIRNLFQRANLAEQDVRTLRGIIKALSHGRRWRRQAGGGHSESGGNSNS